MTTPPFDRWSEDEALRELARLARDLRDVDADEAWRRLGRLTAEQRAAVQATLREFARTRLSGEVHAVPRRGVHPITPVSESWRGKGQDGAWTLGNCREPSGALAAGAAGAPPLESGDALAHAAQL
jgi:hypothetical protein